MYLLGQFTNSIPSLLIPYVVGRILQTDAMNNTVPTPHSCAFRSLRQLHSSSCHHRIVRSIGFSTTLHQLRLSEHEFFLFPILLLELKENFID